MTCLVIDRVIADYGKEKREDNAQLSDESSEKTIDSLPRRYAVGTLASSSTTPCALHSNTTSLHVHIANIYERANQESDF